MCVIGIYVDTDTDTDTDIQICVCAHTSFAQESMEDTNVLRQGSSNSDERLSSRIMSLLIYISSRGEIRLLIVHVSLFPIVRDVTTHDLP